MNFQINDNTGKVEVVLDFYKSGGTKLSIIDSGKELSADYELPYKIYDYYTFLSKYDLSEYYQFLYIKNLAHLNLYMIDYSEVIKTNIYTKEIISKMNSMNISYDSVEKAIDATQIRTSKLINNHLTFKLKEVIKISSLLDINPNLLIKNISDSQLIDYLKNKICM